MNFGYAEDFVLLNFDSVFVVLMSATNNRKEQRLVTIQAPNSVSISGQSRHSILNTVERMVNGPVP